MKLTRRNVDSEIPTSSMADIAFLLIIFFMVTAVFSSTKGLEFQLPKEEDKSTPDTEEAVFIKVNADSSILVDCRPMSRAEILPYLRPKLMRNPEKPVILYTDPLAPYQAMINAYDELSSVTVRKDGWKVKNISVPTQTEVQEYVNLFGMNPFESQCAG